MEPIRSNVAKSMSAAHLRRAGRRCRCGCMMDWTYLKRYLEMADRIRCKYCNNYITVRCTDCLKKCACSNKHLYCERCGICYLCTKCPDCIKGSLILADPGMKICCKCKKIISYRCNNCMIKHICLCGEQYCSECIEGCTI
jgi:hypothetical protein